jgi:hypothetical protein
MGSILFFWVVYCLWLVYWLWVVDLRLHVVIVARTANKQRCQQLQGQRDTLKIWTIRACRDIGYSSYDP